MDKRCGLPLALPLHAKKLCPNLPFSRRFGHRVLVWKTGKKPSRFCRSTSAAGVGYALRYREIPPDRKIRKSGHGRDGHVRFFLPAAFRQRKLCRDTACLPRLQRRSAAGALGRTPFPDRLKGHAAAFSRSPALRGPFGEKETRESHRPAGATGYRPSGCMPRRGGGSVAAQETPAPAAGTMAPCLTLFL